MSYLPASIRAAVRELTATAVGLAVYGPGWWLIVAGGLMALNVTLGIWWMRRRARRSHGVGA